MNRFFRSARVALVAGVSAALLLVLARAADTATTPAGAGPLAEFPAPSVDFGEVKSSEVRRHEFEVKNVGGEPLIITAVSPSCGCTTTGDWDREIAPGGSGRIPIEFNPANFSGVVTKAVIVTTNDPARPTHTLELKATIWRPFQVQPTFANFLPVEGEPSLETKVIRIMNNLEHPTELRAPRSSDPRFKSELKTVRPGKEFELHVSYDSTASAASPSATITIETSSPDQPTLTVTAFAMPQPAVVVVPGALQLPPAPMNQDYVHNIVIRSNSRTPLQVTQPTVTGEELALQLTEAQPGRLFYLKVTVPHTFRLPADRGVAIAVKTSHPKFPELRIPVMQALGPARTAAVEQPAGQK